MQLAVYIEKLQVHPSFPVNFSGREPRGPRVPSRGEEAGLRLQQQSDLVLDLLDQWWAYVRQIRK